MSGDVKFGDDDELDVGFLLVVWFLAGWVACEGVIAGSFVNNATRRGLFTERHISDNELDMAFNDVRLLCLPVIQQ